jgi:hypothetical protein
MKKCEKYFIEKMDNMISTMTNYDQDKMKFAKHFLNRFLEYDSEDMRIRVAPTDKKVFQYFLFAIVLEYDNWNLKSDIEKITSG